MKTEGMRYVISGCRCQRGLGQYRRVMVLALVHTGQIRETRGQLMRIGTMGETDDLETFLSSYVECALWSSVYFEDEDSSGVPFDDEYEEDDIAESALWEMMGDCVDFINANADDLSELDPGQAGHDFWLTRNHHGAGYWDRGLGEVGDRLTKAAQGYGESDLYVGYDGKVYV